MTEFVLSLIAIWLVCGFIGSGFICKYWDGRFPNLYVGKPDDQFWSDFEDVAMFMLFGAAGLLVAFFGGYIRYGWRMPFSTYKGMMK